MISVRKVGLNEKLKGIETIETQLTAKMNSHKESVLAQILWGKK